MFYNIILWSLFDTDIITGQEVAIIHLMYVLAVCHLWGLERTDVNVVVNPL